jgi:hypothetical protein
MKSSFHSLIPFLPLFCNCQLNSIPLLPSSYPGRLTSRNSTRFFSTELFFITTYNGSRKKNNFSIVGKECLQRRCIATELLNCCLLIAAEICLPSRCIALNIYSAVISSGFGRHVTVFTVPLPSNGRLFWLHYSDFRLSLYIETTK